MLRQSCSVNHVPALDRRFSRLPPRPPKYHNLLTDQVRGVNRVVYDITSKPPGT
jgi:GMP synthase PP-ATPase subunit